MVVKAKASSKTAVKKAVPAKKPAMSTRLVCEECGLILSVDDWGTSVTEVFCCEEKMKVKPVRRAYAPKANKAATAKAKR